MCEFIRRTTRLREVPILVMSEQTSAADRAYAEEAGADGFLPKPFSLNQFTEQVRALMAGNPLEHAPPSANRLKLAAASLLLALAFDGATAPAEDAPASRLVVHLLPLGAISDEMVEKTAEGLRSHVPAIVVVVEPRAQLAPGTEATIRGRYRADGILDWMQGVALAPGKWMGVTDVDIVAKKEKNENWGVLGLGTIDGRCSVLSTFRMKRQWENGGAPEPLVRERLWKTAVHELGHTLGLSHCPVKGCIMEDAHGTVKTRDSETALCPDCARRLRPPGNTTHAGRRPRRVTRPTRAEASPSASASRRDKGDVWPTSSRASARVARTPLA